MFDFHLNDKIKNYNAEKVLSQVSDAYFKEEGQKLESERDLKKGKSL